MSNLANNVEKDCGYHAGCSQIKIILSPKETDLGGFNVRRSLPVKQCRSIGPWVFFDEMGPANFEPRQGIDVRPHPHIGLATVTYLFEGEMLHRDSLGNTVIVKVGDVNLMIAGKGIVHSERQREEVKANSHKLHGLQLWLALPESHQQMDPEFHHYDKTEIPKVNVEGVEIRLLIGEAYGVYSPVKTLSKTIYAEATLEPGQSMVLPDLEECGLYVLSGQVSLKNTRLEQTQMAIFDNTKGIKFKANTRSSIAIIGGDSIGNRFIEWNFVSTQKQLISQAKQDWQEGLFKSVVGDEKEFIELPK